MRVTIKDVANRAGVSPATVSHVINDTRFVREETRSRVFKAIEECDYSVNPIARNLRSGYSMMIGFIASNLSNYFYMEVARGLNEVLQKSGYNLIFIDSHENTEIEKKNIQNFIRYSPDGMIIVPVENDCRYMQSLFSDHYPIVFIDREPEGFGRDIILATNFEGTYEVINLLLRKGHKKIGFIASRDNETIRERFGGYRQALRDGGLEPEKEYVSMGRDRPESLGELKHGRSYRIMENLVSNTEVTAVFSANNLATVGAYNYLKENRIRMPDEMALASFDDSFWFSMASPAITAVTQAPEEFGVKAADLLLQRIRGDKGPYREVRISTKLIVRDSC